MIELSEAKRLLEDRAFLTGGGQVANAWEKLLNLPWPSARVYAAAIEDAGGDARLVAAVRAWAVRHLERMRSRRMAGGAEDAALRAAAGLPSWREEHEARARALEVAR